MKKIIMKKITSVLSSSFLFALSFMPAACSKPVTLKSINSQTEVFSGADVVRVIVDERGYTPAQIKVAPDVKEITLEFERTTDSTCAREVVSKDLGIDQELPLNKKVKVKFSIGDAKSISFGCHMDMMFKGVIIKK